MREVIVLTSTYYKPHFGGIENSLYYLANEYNKIGKKVIILSSDTPFSKKSRLKSHDFDLDIEIIRYKRYIPKLYLDYLIKPFIDVLRIKKILKNISKKFLIKNVIARSPETALSSVQMGLKTSYLVPGIVKHQNYILPKSIFDLKSHLLNNLVLTPNIYQQKKALLLADVFVFSENMKQQVYNFIKKKIEINIVKPGVDQSKFKKRNIKKNNENFVFLIVARLIKDKSIDLAIKALSKTKNAKSKLLIVGDGPEEFSLKELVVKLNLSDRVVFKGKISSNIEFFYRKADCYLMSSTNETFGQTILEALSVGLPIIAWEKSDMVKTATSEIISDNVNGFLIKYNVDSMAKAMLKIIDLNYDQKLSIAKNNIELISENYQWKFLSKNLIKK